jgi:L-lactate dehydrogenase complex protein LldF
VVFGSPRRLALAEKLGALGGRLAAIRGGRWLPGPARRWTAARDVPVPARESFRVWWRKAGRR